MPKCKSCSRDRDAGLFAAPYNPVAACGHHLCTSCIDQDRNAWSERCHKCNNVVCKFCLSGGSCQTCRSTCHGCPLIGGAHPPIDRGAVQCAGCDEYFCPGCAGKFKQCKACGKTRCGNCVPKQKESCGTCKQTEAHSALMKANLKPKQRPDSIVHCTRNDPTTPPGEGEYLAYGADLDLCPRCNQAPETHTIPQIKDTAATRAKVNELAGLLTGIAGGAHRPPHMIGVLMAKTPNGNIVYLAAMSGWANFPAGWEGVVNAAGFVPCATIPAQTMAKNSIDHQSAVIDPPLAAVTNATGQCAAPKLIQTALRAGYKPIEMTEIWWDPDHVNANLVDGTVYSSCDTCQDNVTQMLCP